MVMDARLGSTRRAAAAGVAALAGPRADAQALDHVDRRGGAEGLAAIGLQLRADPPHAPHIGRCELQLQAGFINIQYL